MKCYPKKILIVTPYWEPAKLQGAERINREIALFLSKKGFQVKVLTSDSLGVRYFRDLIKPLKVKDNNYKDKKIEVFRLPHDIILGFYFYLKYKLFNFLNIATIFT